MMPTFEYEIKGCRFQVDAEDEQAGLQKALVAMVDVEIEAAILIARDRDAGRFTYEIYGTQIQVAAESEQVGLEKIRTLMEAPEFPVVVDDLSEKHPGIPREELAARLVEGLLGQQLQTPVMSQGGAQTLVPLITSMMLRGKVHEPRPWVPLYNDDKLTNMRREGAVSNQPMIAADSAVLPTPPQPWGWQ